MVGALAMFAEGSFHRVNSPRVIVGHDADGLYAYSSVCTHRGCTVPAPGASGVSTCPCHRAQYDRNGAVLRGPATLPLQHYAVEVCAGNVYVNAAMAVAAGVRTPAG